MQAAAEFGDALGDDGHLFFCRGGQRQHHRVEPAAQRALGALCLIVSVALALPVPFANMAPSIALCVIGLGVLERDGVWIILGVVAALASLLYVAGLGYAVVKSAIFVLMNAF